jgi:hypothetical protein
VSIERSIFIIWEVDWWQLIPYLTPLFAQVPRIFTFISAFFLPYRGALPEVDMICWVYEIMEPTIGTSSARYLQQQTSSQDTRRRQPESHESCPDFCYTLPDHFS